MFNTLKISIPRSHVCHQMILGFYLIALRQKISSWLSKLFLMATRLGNRDMKYIEGHRGSTPDKSRSSATNTVSSNSFFFQNYYKKGSKCGWFCKKLRGEDPYSSKQENLPQIPNVQPILNNSPLDHWNRVTLLNTNFKATTASKQHCKIFSMFSLGKYDNQPNNQHD